MIKDELKRYDKALCSYFEVGRKPSGHVCLLFTPRLKYFEYCPFIYIYYVRNTLYNQKCELYQIKNVNMLYKIFYYYFF